MFTPGVMGPCLSQPDKVHHDYSAFEKLDEELAEQERNAASPSVRARAGLSLKMASIKMGGSTRDLGIKPPSCKGNPHPTIDVGESDWNVYLDDNHNPYFYNSSSGESQWTIPSELRDKLERVFENPDCVTAVIKVPGSVRPGRSFSVDVFCQPIELVCPGDCAPGDEIELRFPLYTEEDVSAAAAAVTTAAALAAAGGASDVVVDALSAWSALAAVASESLPLIEKDVAMAKDVLAQVSGGCYLDDLIFQLTWSYRVAQLELAVKECFRIKGNFRDSSPYDNCKGVRRYSTGGLVEWWEDLKNQRLEIDAALSSADHNRVFGDTTGLFRAEEKSRQALEETILTGDPSGILQGLLQRKHEIELELDNDTAQMIAIVSIEGPPKPPSKQSLDAVHDYLAESIASSQLDMIDLTEEVEDFLSNTLEPRHRFVVDVVMRHALLEFELDGLLRQIADFSAPPSHAEDNKDKDSANGGVGGGNGQNDEAAAVVAAQHNAALQELLSIQHLAANELSASLEAKKSAQKKALLERIEQQRIKKLLMLKKDGVEAEEAAAVTQAECDREIATGLQKIQDDASAALAVFNKQALEEMKRLGESEEARLSKELQANKDRRLKALQERLQRRRDQAQLEVAQTCQHLSQSELEAAIDAACAAVDREGAVEAASIEDDAFTQLRDARITLLADIKSQHEQESQRLEKSLLAAQDDSKRALRNRLNSKLKKTASGIFSREANAGNPISAAESLALAQADLDAEEAEVVRNMEKAYAASLANSRKAIADSLKEVHVREVAKLEGEMQQQEASQRTALQKRLEARRKEKEAEIAAAGNDEGKKGRIKAELEQEEGLAKAESEAFIAKLKSQHEEEAQELGLALLDKKAHGSLNLKKRLEKKKAKKAADDEMKQQGLVKIDDLVASFKVAQQQQVQRLRDLIEAEKTAQVGSSVIRDRGRLLMQFSVTHEAMIEGLRKRSLYHLKAIKAAGSDEVAPDAAQKLLSDASSYAAAEVALEQVLSRSSRDLAGMVDVQQADRASTLQKLKENGASKRSRFDAQQKIDEEARAALALEVQKDMLCVSALRVLVPDLMEAGQGPSLSRGVLRQADSSIDLHLLLEANENDNQVAPFGASIQTWLRGVLPLSSLYGDALNTLLEHFDLADRNLQQAEVGEGPDVAGASRRLRDCLLKPLLGVLMRAYCADTRVFEAPRFEAYAHGGDAPRDLVAATVKATYAQLETTVTQAYEESATSGGNSSDARVATVYAQSLLDWLAQPVVSAQELAASPKFVAKPPRITLIKKDSHTAEDVKREHAVVLAAMRLEAKEREQELVASLAAKVEKKKRDLQARLAVRRAAAGSAAEGQQEDQETLQVEIDALDKACIEVGALLRLPGAKLDEIDADGLMKAVEQAASGVVAVSSIDLASLQRQVEINNSTSATQRLLQQQLESAGQLDIANKIKASRDKKNLQDRLLKRQKKKEREEAAAASVAASFAAE